MTKLEAFKKIDAALTTTLAAKLAAGSIVDSKPLDNKNIRGIYHDVCAIKYYMVGFYTFGDFKGTIYATSAELSKDDLNQLMLSDGICLDKTSERYEGQRIYNYIAVELPQALKQMFRSKYKCRCE
jgi:hypothetical protein